MNIWVDVVNAPHVLVLTPIMNELKNRGHTICITARKYGQTIPLLDLYGHKYIKVGHHPGKNKFKKVLSLLVRGLTLYFFIKKRKFDIALCHGSRSIILTTKMLHIPLVVLGDYEYTSMPTFMRKWVKRVITPEVIPHKRYLARGLDISRVVQYPGLKEEFYVYDFEPTDKVLDEIGVNKEKIIVLIRPPATMAHYHSTESEQLFWHALNFLSHKDDVQIILLPRTSNQFSNFKSKLERLNVLKNIFIPSSVVHGPNLIWNSDIVISGGGTMNREAACLGVPVYSIFRGPIGAVDHHLSQIGKLKLLENEEMVEDIVLEKRKKGIINKNHEHTQYLINYVVDKIIEVA